MVEYVEPHRGFDCDCVSLRFLARMIGAQLKRLTVARYSLAGIVGSVDLNSLRAVADFVGIANSRFVPV